MYSLAACASGDIGRTVILQYRKKPPNIGIYMIKLRKKLHILPKNIGKSLHMDRGSGVRRIEREDLLIIMLTLTKLT